MWITSFHRFPSRAAFLATCAQAGWQCPLGQDPELPHGVAMDIVGPLMGPASLGEGGVPIPADVIDPRPTSPGMAVSSTPPSRNHSWSRRRRRGDGTSRNLWQRIRRCRH